MKKLKQMISSIQRLDEAAIKQTQNHLDQLTKPPGSLGKLEDIVLQIAGIRGEMLPDISKKAVVVMAADHGVCEEGISAYPQEVTQQMVLNFLNGGAAVNVLSRQAGADVFCVDIGVKGTIEHPDLYHRKIKSGTNNIANGAAMSEEEAIQAIHVGIDMVNDLFDQGYRLVATGEMGIGNTTSSAAILSALTNTEIDRSVGRGTGIDDERWIHKKEVVRRALEINASPDQAPLDVLSKLGGLEIAGLVGVILGAAHCRIPVVTDGFISSAAALVAVKMAPLTLHYIIPSHRSREQGHDAMLEAIGLKPILHMDMCLGEGTGAVLCFPIIESALKLLSEMATFSSAGVSNKDSSP